MLPPIEIRQAVPEDMDAVTSVLHEAAAWLEERNMPLWRETELSPTRVAADVAAQLFFLATLDSKPVGIVMFQLEDQMFWPDAAPDDAAYIHRLAIRRRYAGAGLSTAILNWAVRHTRDLNRRWLRMDCFADRPKLRAVYERFGFRYHDDRQVGPYHVARYEYDIAQPFKRR